MSDLIGGVLIAFGVYYILVELYSAGVHREIGEKGVPVEGKVLGRSRIGVGGRIPMRGERSLKVSFSWQGEEREMNTFSLIPGDRGFHYSPGESVMLRCDPARKNRVVLEDFSPRILYPMVTGAACILFGIGVICYFYR